MLAARSVVGQDSYPKYPATGAVVTEGGKDLTGACICDLTPDACDSHCCCDTDCSAELIEAFKKEGQRRMFQVCCCVSFQVLQLMRV